MAQRDRKYPQPDVQDLERSQFGWLYFKRGAELGAEYYTPSLLPPSNSRRQASAFRKGRAAHLLCSGVRKRRITAVVGRVLIVVRVIEEMDSASCIAHAVPVEAGCMNAKAL